MLTVGISYRKPHVARGETSDLDHGEKQSIVMLDGLLLAANCNQRIRCLCSMPMLADTRNENRVLENAGAMSEKIYIEHACP